MNFATVTLISLGLAMDSFSVSVTSGFTRNDVKVRHAFRVAFFFGLFQAVMPIIGWLVGVNIIDFISDFDHWVAFILLTLIGCRMIYESVRAEPSNRILNILNPYTLILLSIATSIDAFAVGLTFPWFNVSPIMPAITIGAVTFTLSLLGVLLGKGFGSLLGSKVGIAGGIILILIGIKILVEHAL